MKITFAIYCETIKALLLPWLEKVPVSRHMKPNFIQDNALSHSSKLMKACLTSMGFRDQQHSVPSIDELAFGFTRLEPLWEPLSGSVVFSSAQVYADGRQFTLKDEFWRAIETGAVSISPSTIEKLTESFNARYLMSPSVRKIILINHSFIIPFCVLFWIFCIFPA